LPEWQQISRFVLDQEFVLDGLPHRPLDSHKGTFGTALIVAGSKNYAGAALLSGKAAFRSGTGWVKMAIPSFLHPYLVGHFREATWVPLPGGAMGFCMQDADVLTKSLDKETAILLGPGFGQNQETEDFVHAFVRPDLAPMVVDADGLKLLSKADRWWDKLPPRSVLTPHPGEMSILTGISVGDIQAERITIAEQYAQKWGHIVVLKGAFTIVAVPGGKTVILPSATPALARAGTGDVLAGLITGLLAQGMAPFDAAAAGVWLHAQAGLQAAKEKGSTAGVLAGDLIEVLPGIMPY
jgi:NAD(P)H-hydrate epimerase